MFIAEQPPDVTIKPPPTFVSGGWLLFYTFLSHEGKAVSNGRPGTPFKSSSANCPF